jgi:aspartyl-tRNA(Asn)/glutamyl-tRNA(Gln) amidotransferase subunit A
VSRAGALPLSTSLDCVGVLASTIRDAAEILACVAGPDKEDPTTAPHGSWNSDVLDFSYAKSLRIGVLQGYFTSNLATDHGLALERALSAVASCGLRMGDATVCDMDAVVAAANVILGVEAAAVHLTALSHEASNFSDSIRTRIENGFAYSAIEYLSALKYRPTALQRFLTVTQGFDVLVCVTYGQPTPTLAQLEGRRPEETTALVAALSHWTRPINFLGLPAASVPIGTTSDGMPAGLQIIAKPFREDHIVAVADAFERARGEFFLPAN